MVPRSKEQAAMSGEDEDTTTTEGAAGGMTVDVQQQSHSEEGGAVFGNKDGMSLQSLLHLASDFLLSPPARNVDADGGLSRKLPRHMADSDLLAWFDEGDHRLFSRRDGSGLFSEYCTPGTSSSGDNKRKAAVTATTRGTTTEITPVAQEGGTDHLSSGCHEVVGGGCRKEHEQFQNSKGKSVAATTSIADGSCGRRSKSSTSCSKSERKRREVINEKMKTLQKLVPNCRENDDKVSLLDKTIRHIQQCQGQALARARAQAQAQAQAQSLPYAPPQALAYVHAQPHMLVTRHLNSAGFRDERPATNTSTNISHTNKYSTPMITAMVPSDMITAILQTPFIPPLFLLHGANATAADAALSSASNSVTTWGNMPYQAQMPMDMESLNRLVASYQHLSSKPSTSLNRSK